jgi:hypothetical protein
MRLVAGIKGRQPKPKHADVTRGSNPQPVPSEDERPWDSAAVLRPILASGPVALVECLHGLLPPAGEELGTPAERTAARIAALGGGKKAAKRLVSACYEALPGLDEVSRSDERQASNTIRRLLACWLPKRYSDESKLHSRHRIDSEQNDACPDLDVATDNAIFTDVYVARADDLSLDLESREEAFRSKGTIRPIVGRRSLPLPAALGAQIQDAAEAANEIANGFAEQFPGQCEETIESRREFTRRHLAFLRQRGRAYSPRYLAISSRDIPEDVLAALKLIYPPLRLVSRTGALDREEGEILQFLLYIFWEDNDR